MRNLLLIIVLGGALAAWSQDSQSSSKPAPQQDSSHSADSSPNSHTPDLSAPRSDRVNAGALESGQSSSKDSMIDLSPPPDDDKAHPNSSKTLDDSQPLSDENGTSEFHAWDPHKAAKDVEVGDFYFKRKNYKAAEDRYREALYYKDNDAVATYRLAICLEKLGQPDEARQEYESYLRILPYGPESEQVHKALERLKETTAKTKPTK